MSVVRDGNCKTQKSRDFGPLRIRTIEAARTVAMFSGNFRDGEVQSKKLTESHGPHMVPTLYPPSPQKIVLKVTRREVQKCTISLNEPLYAHPSAFWSGGAMSWCQQERWLLSRTSVQPGALQQAREGEHTHTQITRQEKLQALWASQQILSSTLSALAFPDC